MLKKTRNLHYNEKYFVLTPYRLLYYEDKTRNKLAGCFNLVALECKELSRSGLTMKYGIIFTEITIHQGETHIKVPGLAISRNLVHEIT